MRLAALAGGWLLAAAIVWLSLTPSPPDPGIAYADKVGHFLAYGALMFWFALLYRAGPFASPTRSCGSAWAWRWSSRRR